MGEMDHWEQYLQKKERRWEEEGTLQKRGVGRKFLKVGKPNREGLQAINQTKGQFVKSKIKIKIVLILE